MSLSWQRLGGGAISFALLFVGVTLAPGLVLAGEGGAEFHYGHFNGTGVVSPLKEFEVGNMSLHAWQRLDIRRWHLVADVGRSTSLSRLHWADGDAAFHFEPAVSVTSLGFQISPPKAMATVALGVQIPDAGIQKPGVSMSVRLQPSSLFGLGLAAMSPPKWPTHMAATFDGEGGALDWNVQSSGTHWQTDFTPNAYFKVSGHLWQNHFEPGSPDLESAAYSFRPTGMLLRRSLEMEKQLPSRQLVLGIELSNGDYTGQLHAYTQGQGFGQLGVMDATWHTWRASVSQAVSSWHWSAQASGGAAQFASFGVVKFWPFSEGLETLLGARRQLQISGNADWWQAGGAISKWMGSHFEMGLGIDAYRIYPSITTLSWQPLMFGMGVMDPQLERLSITRMDLGAVQLNSRVQLSHRLSAHASLKQWLPLGIEKVDTSSGSEVSASAAPSSGSHSTPFGVGLVVSAGLSVKW